jgi:hypothetical protein
VKRVLSHASQFIRHSLQAVHAFKIAGPGTRSSSRNVTLCTCGCHGTTEHAGHCPAKTKVGKSNRNINYKQNSDRLGAELTNAAHDQHKMGMHVGKKGHLERCGRMSSTPDPLGELVRHAAGPPLPPPQPPRLSPLPPLNIEHPTSGSTSKPFRSPSKRQPYAAISKDGDDVAEPAQLGGNKPRTQAAVGCEGLAVSYDELESIFRCQLEASCLGKNKHNINNNSRASRCHCAGIQRKG